MHFNSQVTLVTSSQPNWAFATAPATWLCELPDCSVWNLGYAVVQDTHYDFSTDKQLVHLLAWCHEWNEDTPAVKLEMLPTGVPKCTRTTTCRSCSGCFRVWVSCSTNEASLRFTCRTWGGHVKSSHAEFLEIWRDVEIILWICVLQRSSKPVWSWGAFLGHQSQWYPRTWICVDPETWWKGILLSCWTAERNCFLCLLPLIQVFKSLNSPQCPKFASRYQGIVCRNRI